MDDDMPSTVGSSSATNEIVGRRTLSSGDGNTDVMYAESYEHWKKVVPTVYGMLGGFPEVNGVDISTSKRFLLPFLKTTKSIGAITGCARALDCGAGIGRITKHLLSELFQQVDMLEQNAAFLDEARNSYLGDKANRVDRYICSGIQDFEPDNERYDVIWVQWVLSHVPDEGVQRFLDRSKRGLREGGLLVIKENVCGRGDEEEEEERDVHDVTITRTRRVMREMVVGAGYTIVKELKQTKFPKGLYEVRLFACRPSIGNS